MICISLKLCASESFSVCLLSVCLYFVHFVHALELLAHVITSSVLMWDGFSLGSFNFYIKGCQPYCAHTVSNSRGSILSQHQRV